MSFPWAKQYEPTNGLTKFLDEKLPVPPNESRMLKKKPKKLSNKKHVRLPN